MDSISKALYILEHKIIPECLYRDGIDFVAALPSDDNILSKIFIQLLLEDGVDNPYGDEPIKVDPLRIEHILVARIIFPEPQMEPLCYESYILFDTETYRAAYYCLEKSEALDGIPFLCGWSEDGVHLNFDKCDMDQEGLIGIVLRLFLDPTGAETPELAATYSPETGQVETVSNKKLYN